MTIKVEINSEPPILAEPEAVNELEPKSHTVYEPELEVKEPLIKTLVKLSVEPTMELVPSLTCILLRSPDVYDLLQIFLQETGSQEFSIFMVQSTLCLVFIMDDSSLSATCDWLDLSSFIAGLVRKSVSLPSP